MGDHPKRARREVIDADEASAGDTTSETTRSILVVDEHNVVRPCTSLESAVSGTATPLSPARHTASQAEQPHTTSVDAGGSTGNNTTTTAATTAPTTTTTTTTDETAAPVDQALEHHMTFLELDDDFKACLRSMSPNTRREVLNDIVRERRMTMAVNMLPEAVAGVPFAPTMPGVFERARGVGGGSGGGALHRTHRTRSHGGRRVSSSATGDGTHSSGRTPAGAGVEEDDDEGNVFAFMNLGNNRGFTLLPGPNFASRRQPTGNTNTAEASAGTGRRGRHVSRTTMPPHEDSEYEDVPEDEDEEDDDDEDDEDEDEVHRNNNNNNHEEDDEDEDNGVRGSGRHRRGQRERHFFLNPEGLVSLLFANGSMRPEQQQLIELYTRNLIARLHQNAAMAAMSLDRDIDDMSYEELLELEERIGNVSKGLTPAQTRASLTVLPHEPTEGRCAVCQEEWPTSTAPTQQAEEAQSTNNTTTADAAAAAGTNNTNNNNTNTNASSREPHAEVRRCVRIKVCDHVFHEDCIVEWLRHNKTCPVCTREVILT